VHEHYEVPRGFYQLAYMLCACVGEEGRNCFALLRSLFFW